MSLVTRCTACGTLFKVVADQLKVSDGWVRCGQCGTVFDAQAHLVEQPAAPSAIPSETSPGSAGSAQARAADSILPSEASADPKSVSDALIEPDASSVFQPGKLRDSELLDSDQGPSTASWVDSSVPPDFQTDDALNSAALTNTQGPTAQPSAAPLPETAETPGFIKQARAAQRWRSPWVRAALGLAGLLLLGLLGVQVVGQEKDRIAAQWPQARPWLLSYCQALSCQLQPYQRIEAIAVESSSFNRINKNNPSLEATLQSYRLGIGLKNGATLAVAMPHVELSLQDTQDQVVLRRVLSPADLGISAAELAPGQELLGGATLQLSTAALAGRRVQGYRVLAFYP
jgi:predicted Zn finger-like uncharacterized protein